MKKVKQILSIDIGGAYVKFVSAEISGGEIDVIRSFLKEVSGEEKERIDSVRNAVKEFTESGYTPKQVLLSLSCLCAEVMRIDLPYMPQNEIIEALKWRVKDKINFSIEDASIDFTISDEYKKEDGLKQMCVIAAVSDKKELYKILSVFNELNLEVLRIDTSPTVFCQYLEQDKSLKNSDTVAMVEVGAKHTYVTIYKNNKLEFIRKTPISSMDINETMCGTLINDKGKVEIAKEEAESIKRQYGFPIDRTDMLNDRISAVHIVATVRPVLERLATEIKRTFNYYVGEFNGEEPKKIFFTGGGALLKNLDVFIKGELGIEAVLINEIPGVQNLKTIEKNEVPQFMTALSILLPSESKKINLLPVELAREKNEAIQKISIRMVGFATLSVLILIYIGLTMRISYFNKKSENAVSYRKSMLEVISLYEKVSERANAISSLKAKEIKPDIAMKILSNILPSNMFLEQMEILETPKEVRIKGVLIPTSLVPEDELTKFMDQIESSEFVRNANLGTVEKSKDNIGRLTLRFEIMIEIK